MHLIAFVGSDRENWGQITALLNRMECEQIVLVANKGAAGFPANEKCKVIDVKSESPLLALREELDKKLRPLVGREFEVAVSLASGTGKEHLALLSALLNIPVGIKLVAYTKEGVQFLT